jgi:hypothetical protein
MVEGVVAIPFFILMLAATVFVGGFYAMRIDAQAQAREFTWLKAVNENCDASPDGAIEGLTVIDSSELGELSKSPLAALCDKDVGVAEMTAKRSYKVGIPKLDAVGDIDARATCPCNESPVSGDVAYESAVEYLWQVYQDRGTMPPNATNPSLLIAQLFGGFAFGGGGAMAL